MSRPRVPVQALPMVSCLSAELDALWPEVLSGLVEIFGPLWRASEPLPFEVTSYYEPEMGGPLFRRLAMFERLIDQDRLPEFKWATAGLEKRFARPDGRRRVNLDPGMICQERLTLATFKNFTHRTYLGDCVFADVTLIWSGGDWMALPWTFRDYQDRNLQRELTLARARHKALTANMESPCPRA